MHLLAEIPDLEEYSLNVDASSLCIILQYGKVSMHWKVGHIKTELGSIIMGL